MRHCTIETLLTSPPASEFKWIDPREFESNKYSSNILTVCVLEIDIEYSRELRQLNYDYPLVPYKVGIENEILSDYQLKIAVFYNINSGGAIKLMPNVFDRERYVLQYENLQLYLRRGLKLKKYILIKYIELNQSQWLKPNVNKDYYSMILIV